MNDKAILVSIVMPCYNVEKYFVEAIESILNQTYSHLEIILLNDGSTDRTFDLMNEYSLKDNRIKIIDNGRNIGLIKTLNKGVASSTGEYIARMDADDISEINRIEESLKILIRYPEIAVVSASTFIINMKGKLIQRTVPKAIHYCPLKFVSFFSTPVVHPCVMARSAVLKEHQYHEDYIHSEDYELFTRLIFLGYKIYNSPEPLYYLRVNKASVSNKFETIQINTHTRISKENIEKYFNITYEYFLHKVIINRVKFDVNVSLVKNAIEQLQYLKNVFLQKENCSEEDCKEIEYFLIEQRIDILFQSFKCSGIINRINLLFLMLANIRVFYTKRGYAYILSKIRSKI